MVNNFRILIILSLVLSFKGTLYVKLYQCLLQKLVPSDGITRQLGIQGYSALLI